MLPSLLGVPGSKDSTSRELMATSSLVSLSCQWEVSWKQVGAGYNLIFKWILQIPGLFHQIDFRKKAGKRVKLFSSEKMERLNKVMVPLLSGALPSISECAWWHIPQSSLSFSPSLELLILFLCFKAVQPFFSAVLILASMASSSVLESWSSGK